MGVVEKLSFKLEKRLSVEKSKSVVEDSISGDEVVIDGSNNEGKGIQ